MTKGYRFLSDFKIPGQESAKQWHFFHTFCWFINKCNISNMNLKGLNCFSIFMVTCAEAWIWLCTVTVRAKLTHVVCIVRIVLKWNFFFSGISSFLMLNHWYLENYSEHTLYTGHFYIKMTLLIVIADASEYAQRWFLPWFPREMHFSRTTLMVCVKVYLSILFQ